MTKVLYRPCLTDKLEKPSLLHVRCPLLVVLYTLILLSGLSCTAPLKSPSSPATGLALVGARIYTSPMESPIENGLILLEGDSIVSVGPLESNPIPKHYQVVDCRNKVVTAGFWNSHVHFIEPQWQGADTATKQRLEQQLQAMLSGHGFTYAFDLAALQEDVLPMLNKRIEAGEVNGPTVLRVGLPMVPSNGNPFYIEPLKLPAVGTAAEARLFVKQQVAKGVNGIKIWSASPTRKGIVYMQDTIIQAIAQTTHSYGLPLFAHPTDVKGLQQAISNGVDVLAHLAPEGIQADDTTLLQQMAKVGTALIPTLYLYEWELKRDGVTNSQSHPLMQKALRQLQVFQQAGGKLLFGTDVGYVTDYDIRKEYEWLKVAQVPFQEVLAALTTHPAQLFTRGKIKGTVSRGEKASLVILNSDPKDDIGAFAAVYCTIHKGKIIYKTPG